MEIDRLAPALTKAQKRALLDRIVGDTRITRAGLRMTQATPTDEPEPPGRSREDGQKWGP